jgi:hypothetical protein
MTRHALCLFMTVCALEEPPVIKNALQQMHDCDGVVVGVPVRTR